MVLDHRVPATSAMMADRVEAAEFASVQVRSKRDDQKIAQTPEQGYPDIVVILMSAFATVAGAVEAMKLGAHDFRSQPLWRSN